MVVPASGAYRVVAEQAVHGGHRDPYRQWVGRRRVGQFRCQVEVMDDGLGGQGGEEIRYAQHMPLRGHVPLGVG
ncbi:hypothetical protein [Micromonospora sp. NPDC005189]|uniref:hypothetical protein n=1 Tax=unclassified Micromonospora TaxID=2617518 RepID=UPI0033BB2D5E